MKWTYEMFSQHIYDLTKIDLASYKERQMKRRIDSLISRNGYDSYQGYYNALYDSEELLNRFKSYITINVSEFFRNIRQWDVLENKILPMLYKEHKTLKIWSAACSTGEEPYSLAMLLDRHNKLNDTSILATDIDEEVLLRAREGIYTKKDLENLPQEFRLKYFHPSKEYSTFEISNRIKRHITFKRHDLLRDAFPESCHLIICRNVMIYFTEEAKGKLYEKFHSSLHARGVFFVGSTEQIILPQRYNFAPIETFFYRKI